MTNHMPVLANGLFPCGSTSGESKDGEITCLFCRLRKDFNTRQEFDRMNGTRRDPMPTGNGDFGPG